MKCKVLLFLSLCLFSLVISCVEEQNFDQYDDIAVVPEVEAAMLYMETPEEVINADPGLTFISVTFDFLAFQEQFVADRILDGSLIYQLENTTSKPLRLSIEFLNEQGTILDTETFTMDPAPTAILNREVVYGPTGKSMNILRNTTTLRISGTNLGDTSSVSAAPEPKFMLRSTAKFRIELR
ncbi:MAG: hypothetical protein P8Z38_01390 [Robiginitalea sp.]